MSRRKTFELILGPALFAAATLLLPGERFSFSAGAAVGLVLWMGCWWITMPVATGVTALLPVAVNALFRMVPMDGITAKYFSEIVVLLLGSFLITLTWEETGLDKRIAMKALNVIGTSVRQQVVMWFLLSTVAAFVLPNSVVCAILTPIAVAMLKNAGVSDPGTDRSASVILISIAWGTGVGGMVMPFHAAMNLVAVDYLEKLIGGEFIYTDWIIRLTPFMLAIAAAALVYLLRLCPKKAELHGSREYFRERYAALPAMSRDEKLCLVLFLIPTALAFTRELYAAVLPGLKPAYVFLIFGIICFLVRRQDKSPLLCWKRAEQGVSWGLLFLFAGGLALGFLISETGAATAMAELVSGLSLDGGFMTIFIFVAFTVLLAEISSNTAAAAIALPVVISISEGLGLDPIPYVFIISAAFNCAYMLPTSIRAIPVGYGLRPEYMFKNGLALTVISIALISVLGHLLLKFVPGFGIL